MTPYSNQYFGIILNVMLFAVLTELMQGFSGRVLLNAAGWCCGTALVWYFDHRRHQQ